MSAPGGPIGEDDLHGYVDGQLPEPRAALVDGFLRDNPAVAARLAAYRDQRDLLAARLRRRAEEPIPARLRVAAVVAQRNRRHRAALARAAAACLIFAAGAGAGWLAGTVAELMPESAAAAPDAVAGLAIAAHRLYVADDVRPVEMRAEMSGDLASWISGRLHHDLTVPDLAAEGFRLMGGRVLPGGTDPAAQIMYEDSQHRRLTLYIKTGEAGDSRPRFAMEAGMPAVVWRDDGCGYVVIAELPRDTLGRISDAVFAQMEGEAGSKS